MRLNVLNIAIALCALAAGASAQQISGTILVKKRLTRRNVTAAVPVYERGATVKLGQDPDADPIAYEMSRVVVYLDGQASTSPETLAAPPQIEQLDRRFQPDLVVIPVGTTVSFPNMDPIFHNVFSLSKARTFDLGSYDKGETRKVQFSRPGIVEVYCHLHPNMTATIVVAPNRWYARPDSAGHYQISDVPPGQYTLVAWHKAAGYFRRPIVVETGRPVVADFFIPIGDDPNQEAGLKENAGQAGASR
jgi:plastocyanin